MGDTLYKKKLQISFTVEGQDVLYKAGEVWRFEDVIRKAFHDKNITDWNVRVLAEEKIPSI